MNVVSRHHIVSASSQHSETRPDAVSKVKARIPQQLDKGLYFIAQHRALIDIIIQQDHQIDIRMGVQFTAAVATDGYQADVLGERNQLSPGQQQQLFNDPATGMDQLRRHPRRPRTIRPGDRPRAAIE